MKRFASEIWEHVDELLTKYTVPTILKMPDIEISEGALYQRRIQRGIKGVAARHTGNIQKKKELPYLEIDRFLNKMYSPAITEYLRGHPPKRLVAVE